jgi:hypothetical protein
LSFTVNTSEVISVNTAGGIPRIALNVGGTTAYASYVAGSGTNTLVFQYTVQAGHNDADGITLSGLESNGSTLRDAAGNNLNLTLNSVGTTSNVIVDTTAPTATIQLQGTPQSFAQSVSFNVTFSEPVQNVDIADFELKTVGAMQATLGT